MYICLCKGINETRLSDLFREKDLCEKDLASVLGLDKDDCCGKCINQMPTIVALASIKDGQGGKYEGERRRA